MAIGLDFGTTNSALALAAQGGSVSLIRLEPGEATASGGATLPSLLFFDAEEKGADRRPLASVGTPAIRAALDPDLEGRLIQSVKSHLASRQFTATRVYGSKFEIEDLIAVLLKFIRERMKAEGAEAEPVTVGRPARYVGADTDNLALARMLGALARAGFQDVRFEYEPLAAAFAYERRLNHDELVLIGDFGGGTSDFSLVRVGPGRRGAAGGEAILGVDGVGLAGDALDARIVEHVIAPALGRGSSYVAPSGKSLPVPMWLFESLRQWHRLSFLDSPETRAVLGELIAGTEDQAPLLGLKAVIEERLGYRLARAVEGLKIALSSAPSAPLRFSAGPVVIDRAVARSDFEAWVAPVLAPIRACVERLLESCAVAPDAIDAVFLTGGTAYVPAVRQIFIDRFGVEKLRGGDELVSVALGLALSGAEAVG